jgi:myo-inositol-1(or 4)-monophosphatase
MKQELFQQLMALMRQGGQMMLRAHENGTENGVTVKPGTANFVTVHDVAIQTFLIREIRSLIPDAYFIAEEQDNDYSIFDDEYVFVIDPIDGTTNFIHDFSHSSISVACISRGKTVFGAVYNPYLDEMFHAELGGGAYKNGKPISVSERNMKEAVFSFGSSPYYKKELGAKSFELAYKIFNECADLRRTASAALDLCYVAAGRIEFFFEYSLFPWDYAAAGLIFTEAGGVLAGFAGGPVVYDRPSPLIGANTQENFDRLLEIVNRHMDHIPYEN